MLGLFRRNRKRAAPGSRIFSIIAILCLAGVGALTSCGGSVSNKNAGVGVYKIPVTVTLAGGAAQNINATVIVE